MTKKKREDRSLIEDIEKEFGIKIMHKSDAELFLALERMGLPSLAKLLGYVKKGL